MEKLFKKYFWTVLIVFGAIGLAGSAAYFSISGLSKLFAGSATQVVIMASFTLRPVTSVITIVAGIVAG